VAKYSAEIEILVRGGKQLEAVLGQVNALNKAIEKLSTSGLKPADNAVRTSTATLDKYTKSLLNTAQAENVLTEAIRKRQKQSSAPPPPAPPSPPRGGGTSGSNGSRVSGGGNSRVGGAISSALIGGGFPLLFGQGPAAAAGGALGGVAGGLLGGGFGFALSIVGTALGDIITKAEAFDKSLAALNAGLSTTGSTSITTANDVSKLASSLNVTKKKR
jgi:hypothetical protein